MGLPYRSNPVVGAVGEMAYMKRRKLWKTGEDGLFCSSSAIQTRLGPSSLLEERSEIPIVLLFLLCCRLPPKLGKRPRYIDIDRIEYIYIYIYKERERGGGETTRTHAI